MQRKECTETPESMHSMTVQYALIHRYLQEKSVIAEAKVLEGMVQEKSVISEAKVLEETVQEKSVISEAEVLKETAQEKSVIAEARVLEETGQEKNCISEAGEFNEASPATDSEQLQEINDLIDNLTLFDDVLMSKVFDENIEAAELRLRLILERDDIEVLWVKGQDELKNPVIGGRNIRLDIRAVLGDGRQVNVEVQRKRKGSHVRRARFNSSMLRCQGQKVK